MTVFQVGWDEGKDFWRDSVDEREGVLYGSNHAEHLQRIIFKSVDLEINDVVSHLVRADYFVSFPSPRFHSMLSRSCRISSLFQYFGELSRLQVSDEPTTESSTL